MKKFIYGVATFAALVGCVKEVSTVEPVVEDISKTKYTITAFVDQDETKTSYDANKKFSWVATDSIFVRVLNSSTNKWTWAVFKSTSAGAAVDFEGQVDDDFRPYDVAVYAPSEQVATSSYNGNNVRINLPISYHLDGVGLDKANELPYFNSTYVPSDNPYSVMTLVGFPQEDSSFKFQSALGFLNLNLTDLAADVAYVEITNPSLSLGNYLMLNKSAGAIENTAYWASGTSKYATSFVQYYFTPASDGTASLNIPLPVGTYDTQTTINVYDANGSVVFSKNFTKDVIVERNKIVALAPLKAKYDWVSVGTGKFIDKFLWSVAEFNDYIDVEIEKNQDGDYRLNPYQAAATAFSYTPSGTVSGPAPMVLKLQSDGYVYYDEFASGIFGGSYEYAVSAPYYWSSNYPSYYGSYGKGNNFVAKVDTEGVPANIILSPVYTSVTTSSFTADNYIWANTIQVIFPGANEIDIDASIAYLEITDDSSSDPIVSFNAYLGADIASMKIAAAATPEEALAAIDSDTNVTIASASGPVAVHLPVGSPSGNYYAVAKVIAADGLSPVVNRTITSAVFHYDNPDTDLGLEESVLYGQWTGDITWNRSGQYTAATFSITLAESDSPLEGNILVTEFMGYEGNGSGYMNFNTATGALSIPNGTPIATYNTTYYLGMDDANNAGTGEFVFRYDPVNETLSLEDIMFVGFELYNVSDGADSGRWIGYCYGPNENDNKLLLKKVKEEGDSASPAAQVKTNFVEVAPSTKKVVPALAR